MVHLLFLTYRVTADTPYNDRIWRHKDRYRRRTQLFRKDTKTYVLSESPCHLEHIACREPLAANLVCLVFLA